MKSQACEPCAKRKVRCDKGEPCSNCKRRKKDHCNYPEALPAERINRLEALVRSLGGDPENDARNAGESIATGPSPGKVRSQSQYDDREATRPDRTKSNDPIILEEDGQPYYLESCVYLP